MSKAVMNLKAINQKGKVLFQKPNFLKLLIIKGVTISALSSVVRRLGPFALAIATMYFPKNVFLALIFLAIYMMLSPTIEMMMLIINNNQKYFDLKLEEFVTNIKGKVLEHTRDKIEIEKHNCTKKMEPVVILETVENYISSSCYTRSDIASLICDTIIFLLTVFFLIKMVMKQTSNVSSFAVILIVTVILMVLISSKLLKGKFSIYEESKKVNDDNDESYRDVQEIVPVSLKHCKFLIENLLLTKQKVSKLQLKENIKNNRERVFISILMAISSFVVIVIILFSGKEVNSDSFMNAIAFSQVFTSVIASIATEVNNVYHMVNRIEKNKRVYETDFKKIMTEYFYNESIEEKSYSGDTLAIEPFIYKYFSDGFCLKMENKLILQRGRILLLEGVSGSGKSTFVKIISGEIKLDTTKWILKSIKYFNDTSAFGSRNLLQEITLEADINNVNREKLQAIIEGICLNEKITSIEKMEEMYAKQLSNGLVQRALLARTLYNLDEQDLVCIDEPIGNLDAINAKKVISYIKEYCNKDKKRFVILCTHQYKLIEESVDQKVKISRINSLLSEVVV